MPTYGADPGISPKKSSTSTSNKATVYNATSAPVDFSDYTLKYLYPLADL